MRSDDAITYIGTTNARGRELHFGIKEKDRSRHIYIIGKTGAGKSTLIENLAIQDINNGNGIIFFDPHGSSAEQILRYVPETRIEDTIYFSPSELSRPVAFNIMEDIGYDKRHLVASNLLSSFKKIWGEESWSDRMAHILNNTLLALLEYPNTTLLDVRKMYTDKKFRQEVVSYLKDPQVKSFWTDEFSAYTDRFAAEATPAIQNKIGQFTSNPVIRNIIGQPKSSFDLREVIDNEKLLIVNFKKGLIGDDNASMLGVLLSTKVYLSALSRADLTKEKLDKVPSSNFYVDEFQSFASDTFSEVLSEARKYKLNLIIAHQFIDQLPEVVRDAVFGNVGTQITFRVGPLDAEFLERVYAPYFQTSDLVGLGIGQIYLTLMIDGAGSRPFSAQTHIPDAPPKTTYEKEIIQYTNSEYGHEREKVERIIKEQIEKNYDKNKEVKKVKIPEKKPNDANNNVTKPAKTFKVSHAPSKNQLKGLKDLIKKLQNKKEGPNNIN